MAFIDDFEGEASTVDLADHTPSEGTAWTRTGPAGSFNVTTGGGLNANGQGSRAYYVCDDQGSADQYIEATLATNTSITADEFACCRLVDDQNFIAWKRHGGGSAGQRLTKSVSGTLTDLVTTQGSDDDLYRIECNGSTIKFFKNGSQEGADQTVTDHQTETSQGVVNPDKGTTITWIKDFEAGALAGGGITGTGQADSDDSTTSGSGTLERSGTGTATSGNATTSGEGTAFTIITGSGSAESNDAISDGTGEREITGTASAASNDASSEGTGTRIITGTAVAESEDASTDGTGAVEGAITGSGTAISQNASTSGTGEIESVGTGVAESDDAVTSGAGTLERSGTGTAVSDDATTSGTGTVGAALTGSGSATSEDAETSGSGARVIEGLGSSVSSDAETTGSGTRAITSNVVIFMENASTSGVGERIITGSGSAESGDANTNGFDVFTEDFHTLQNFLNENYPIEGALGDKFRHFLVLKGYTDNKHNYDLFWHYLEDNGFLNDSLWDKYHAATKDGWLWRQA